MAVGQEAPVDDLALECAEGKPILIGERLVFPVEGRGERLLNELDFVVTGIRGSIGSDKPIATEVAVVRLIAEIPAVGVMTRFQKGVFAPFPEESASEARMFFDDFPILGEAPGAVAHGVGIFVHEEGLVCWLRSVLAFVGGLTLLAFAYGGSGDIIFKQSGGGVGLTVEFGNDIHVCVLDRARIILTDFVACRLEGGAVSCFVTEGPEGDADVVAVHAHESFHAINSGGNPNGIVARQDAFVVGQPVGFEVSLVADVETSAVTEFVPQRVVGVVTRADGVEIGLFDQADVDEEAFAGDRAAPLRIVFVSVDAAEFDGNIIEVEDAVADGFGSEARSEVPDVPDAVRIAQDEGDGV